MDKGSVDGTGLTHLGAREYDPVLGRFVSVDPVLDQTDPSQMDGYVYGRHNPVNWSDPTGTWTDGLNYIGSTYEIWTYSNGAKYRV
jgi:RHS repeat-associated protein